MKTASRVVHWLILPTAVLVALATGLWITSLRMQADDARVTQSLLSDVRADLNEESALEWEARAIRGVSAEIEDKRHALKARVGRHLDTLESSNADDVGVQSDLRRFMANYQSAANDMFGAIVGGDLERSERIDRRRVEPAGARLRGLLAAADREEGAEAVEIREATRLKTFLSLGGALIALFVLFWRFRHTEQARERVQARTLEYEATHDHLTGLPNRRRLMADLDGPGGRRLFVFFDLDGFKTYNDTFGHVEGDLLLQRLGRKLAGAVGADGVAYRLGGDEFCLVAPFATGHAEGLVARCVEALSEDGEGFQVRASRGHVVMPDEAPNGAAALVLADHRMYANKGLGRASARQQTRDVVMRVQAEHNPELSEHVSKVAALARATGERLGLSETDVDDLERAAELHDIGKIAIPDAILFKAGPLDEDEWRFMRRHTLVGESMLSAAPALVSVAHIVRSSHERFDGGGYPDGLAGEAIPLASRIVFVCDAFHAMMSDRPYGTPKTADEALAELSRCAGTQFDPQVVAVFRAAQAAPPSLLRAA